MTNDGHSTDSPRTPSSAVLGVDPARYYSFDGFCEALALTDSVKATLKKVLRESMPDGFNYVNQYNVFLYGEVGLNHLASDHFRKAIELRDRRESRRKNKQRRKTNGS